MRGIDKVFLKSESDRTIIPFIASFTKSVDYSPLPFFRQALMRWPSDPRRAHHLDLLQSLRFETIWWVFIFIITIDKKFAYEYFYVRDKIIGRQGGEGTPDEVVPHHLHQKKRPFF
jgi:hypothetical protein